MTRHESLETALLEVRDSSNLCYPASLEAFESQALVEYITKLEDAIILVSDTDNSLLIEEVFELVKDLRT